jgi:hypothetical protein
LGTIAELINLQAAGPAAITLFAGGGIESRTIRLMVARKGTVSSSPFLGQDRNTAVGESAFHRRRKARQRHFIQSPKRRLAAPQKTIYNPNARDGTRRVCDAFFSSLRGCFFTLAQERRRIGSHIRGSAWAANE